MYQSSVAFGNLIQQDSRTFRAQITLGDNSITEGIRSIKINGGSNSEDDFSLGSAVSQYVEIDIAAPDIQFEGHEFLLELGIVVNDSVEEYVPMGYFTAEKPEGDEEQVSIVAYDRMVKTERPCFLSLSDQTNTIDVLKAVGAITGVPVVTEGLASISMQKPVGYTCREVLSYVAQLYGGFAVCNRQGQIEIKTYEDHGYTVGTGRYWDTFTHNDLAYSLEKITCYTGKDESGENISITVGEGMRGISISNPFMTQAALNDVWASLNNYTYMPGSFRFLGDPRIDPWDILTVEDRNGKSYKVPAMKLTQDYDGGLSTEVEAVGKSEAEQESGFQGPMTQQMERYYAQLVLIDHAMVDKLDAETARITYATIENLEAVNATIENLDVTKLTARVATIEEAYIGKAEVNTLLADYASVAQLNAVNAQVTNISGELSTYKTQVAGQFTAFDADITSLKAKDAELETALIGTAKVTDLEAIRTRTQQLETDVAGINTLVNGNLTSDNIQSMVITGDKFTMENGFIKSAMIDSLAADKITGLDINTTKLTVHSNDGKSTWTDNTIQIADADRVRVQIGEDASGDYNIYIWDPSGNLMWNATGATSAGLNDGIIKDVAVAADANISGNKLDIESVIREVNGATTTIKGTRIKLDEQNQTLDAAFTSLKTYAEGVNSKTESNTTAISVAQGQISTLISNTTIVKDGQTVQLKDAFNSTVADVSSIKTTINEHTSLIDQQSGEILAVTTKANTIESDLNGTKQTVSAVQSDLSGTKSRVSTVESGLDGLKSRVTATETSLSKKADGTTVDSLTSRVATAESTLDGFEASLTTTVQKVSANEKNISSHNTRITAAENAISLKVSTSDYNAYKTTVNNEITSAKSRLSTAESSITALNGQIALKVEQTDIDTAVKKVDAKFVNYSTTTQMTAAITAAKDSITQSVSSTYATKASVDTVSGKVTNLTSRVQTAESKLTKEGLTTIVGDYYTTASYVGSAIDGIEIGGRNLIISSKIVRGVWISNTGAETASSVCMSTDFITVQPGESLILQYWQPPNNNQNEQRAWTGTLVYFDANKKYIGGYTSTYFADTHKIIKETVPSNGYYVRASFQFPRPLPVSINDWDNGSDLKWKLEKGTKATDWTPAPEDIQSSIASIQTIATQAADKFNWLVKSGTSATDFTLTDRTATLIAQTISLNGDVKVNGNMLVDGAVTANKIATDAIKSRNYAYLSGDYSTAGTFFDLSNGAIRSKNFAIKSDGSVYMNGMLRSYSSGEMLEISDGIIYGKRGSTVDSLIDTSAYYADGYYLVLRNNNGKIILQADEVSVEGTVSAENFDYVTTTTADIGAVNTSYLTVNQWIDLAGPANIARQGYSSSWVRGRDYAIIQETSLNGYSPVISIKTNDGSWDIGSYDHAAFLNKLAFTYVTDDDHAADNNRFLSQVLFNNDGTIDINTAASGGITITNTISEAQVNVVGSQSGRLVVSAAANFGIYSATHSKWLLRCAPDGTVITAATSDRRKKNDYGEMDRRETLAILRNTTVHEFSYKADKNGIRQYGIMAQELRDALIKEKIGYRPIIDIHGKGVDDNYTDLHHPEEDVEYGIDYTKLVPVLHDGWRYHDETIRSMQSEIISIKRIASKDQAKITSLDVRLQGETTCLRGQISSLQYQLQQAFARIAEQDKLIKQLQAAG